MMDTETERQAALLASKEESEIVEGTGVEVDGGLDNPATDVEKIEETTVSVSENAESGAEVGKETPEEPERPCWKRFLGVFLSLLTSILLSLSLVLVRILHEDGGYHVFTIALWRSQGLLYPSIFILIFDIFRHKHPFDAVWPWNDTTKLKMFGVLSIRSVVGAATVLFMYAAATYIGAPEAFAIRQSSPILTTILAWLLFKESYGFIPAFATVLNIIGLTIISRPPWLFGGEVDNNVLIGLGYGIGSLIGNTMVVLSLRVLRKTSFSVIGIGFGLAGCIISLAGMAYERIWENPETSWDIFLIFALCIVSFGGQGTFQKFLGLSEVTYFFPPVCFTLSLRFEEAGAIALLRCTDIVFTYLWQYILMKTVPDLISVGGTFVIVFGVLLFGARKVVEGLKPEDPWRKKLWFLLK